MANDATGYEAKAAHYAEDARKANDALDRVRAVHEPMDAMHYRGRTQTIIKVCTGCGTDDGNWQRWPCPTIRAIEATR